MDGAGMPSSFGGSGMGVSGWMLGGGITFLEEKMASVPTNAPSSGYFVHGG
eukprot:CAMPEP_0171411770 /NCGR_PEP_ID=MMETSP0880-20121228/30942_1 /TAXON_ID=67004 /ORGANISM="Thalassiosira weissflogii, Strain CCMP1336" /LENGTH=50 /DNA_ID=CAMNT_0011928935 /DNA_START=198 /DNA_END=347 /DNA_ORIENTATION=+